MGEHRKENIILKNYFFFNGGMKILSYKNTRSIMCLNFYFSEKCDLNGVLGLVWERAW